MCDALVGPLRSDLPYKLSCTIVSSSGPACRAWPPAFAWRITISGSAFSSGTPRPAGPAARKVVADFVSDELLAEMLLCPLMFYGNAREHDMEWGQFCILFRSIFLEGLARPWAGIRLILKNLVRKYKSLGGELRLRSGVSRILVRDDQVTKVVLDDGTELEARRGPFKAGSGAGTRRWSPQHAPPRAGRQPPR